MPTTHTLSQTLRLHLVLAFLLIPLCVTHAIAKDDFAFNPEFSFQPIQSDVINRCTNMKTELKQEQISIKSNEKSLSLKIDAKTSKREDINKLIKAHLSSIDDYNSKIESFNKTCASMTSTKVNQAKPTPQPKSPPTPVTKTNVIATPPPVKLVKPIKPTPPPAQEEEMVADQAFVSDERWAQVMLSNEKIKNMHGYFLQIGAFKNAGFAKKLIRKLTKKDWTMHPITRVYVDAVWTGSFNSLAEVQQAKEQLKEQYDLHSYVILLQ